MTLHVALEIDGAGAHPGAWRLLPDPLVLATAGRVGRLAAAAENAGVGLVTIDDSLTPPADGAPARLDAVTRAAAVAPLTSRLGLVPLAHPAVVEPFHLASQLAALDHASAGRAGWVVGDGVVPGARRALDRPVAQGQDLLAETADVVRVARDLWDSWEDDAVVRDTATGRYIDRDRLHYVDFASGGSGPAAGPALRGAADGARAPFTVKGPLIVPRGPQGRPVVVGRAGSVPGELLDVAIVGGGSLDEAAAAADRARAAGAPLAFVDLVVALDLTGGTAERRTARLDELAGRTDRQGVRDDALRYAGPAAGLVELLLGLRGRVDGVRLVAEVLDDDLPVLVRDVLPALRVARAIPTPRPGQTLRDLLGLPRPTNRYAKEAVGA
jgi:alkanesulfonate monooxygenase SsuD/methylene tetrahydromethanopterin reductase-like flavin-dependent oxidoreductase (luciferase family)